MWIWIANKFAQFHAKRLNWSENIPKRFCVVTLLKLPVYRNVELRMEVKVNKKLSCRREAAQRSVSLKIFAKSLQVIRNYTDNYGRKFLLAFHYNYVYILYRFIQSQIMACSSNLSWGSFKVTENGTMHTSSYGVPQ